MVSLKKMLFDQWQATRSKAAYAPALATAEERSAWNAYYIIILQPAEPEGFREIARERPSGL